MPKFLPEKQRILWRAYVPKWSYHPLSGIGADQFGGRWNPVGQPCLYMACELSTAWAEYNQGFVQHPAVIVQLILQNARLVDLTSHTTLDELEIAQDIHTTQWRHNLSQQQQPLTHTIALRLLQKGADGVIYPSFMSPGGHCVALWHWNGDNKPLLKITDPDHRLPQNLASWL